MLHGQSFEAKYNVEGQHFIMPVLQLNWGGKKQKKKKKLSMLATSLPLTLETKC